MLFKLCRRCRYIAGRHCGCSQCLLKRTVLLMLSIGRWRKLNIQISHL